MIRPYTCFKCTRTEKHICLPKGWFTVKRSNGHPNARLEGAGLFCCVECLLDHFDAQLDIPPIKAAK